MQSLDRGVAAAKAAAADEEAAARAAWTRQGGDRWAASGPGGRAAAAESRSKIWRSSSDESLLRDGRPLATRQVSKCAAA